MTARDDAIKAMCESVGVSPDGLVEDLDFHTLFVEMVTAVLDHIPNDVLARLAIERGALEPTGTSHCVSSETKGDRIYNNLVPVYYVAEATQ
jgi:hypothetical protein